MKLVSNGSVAIFAGQKASVTKLCRDVYDKYERNYDTNWPIALSAPDEVSNLCSLINDNIGSEHEEAKSASLGIFAHHGNVPVGIRVAIEHAMKNDDIRFIICTSTLAQGVNLPLKYLLVSSTQQGREKISTRDFQNLMGRAGRAGIFTEGSIVFCDTKIFDKKMTFGGRRRWDSVCNMLSSDQSEPCESMIRVLLGGIHNIYRTDDVLNYIGLVNLCIKYPDIALKVPALLAKKFGVDALDSAGYPVDSILSQIKMKIKIIESIESFIMAHNESYEDEEGIIKLAEGTLGYFLADEEEKEQILTVFKTIGDRVRGSVPIESKRIVYGKSLFGVNTALKIEAWLSENRALMTNDMSSVELLDCIWPIMIDCITNKKIKDCNDSDALKEIVISWLEGTPYKDLYLACDSRNLMFSSRATTVGNIVEIFENGFAFEGTLVINAIIELLGAEDVPDEDLVLLLKCFQKRLKYGLPSLEACTIQELGFIDRTLAVTIEAELPIAGLLTRKEQKKILKRNAEQFIALSQTWPRYYQELVLEICDMC